MKPDPATLTTGALEHKIEWWANPRRRLHPLRDKRLAELEAELASRRSLLLTAAERAASARRLAAAERAAAERRSEPS